MFRSYSGSAKLTNYKLVGKLRPIDWVLSTRRFKEGTLIFNMSHESLVSFFEAGAGWPVFNVRLTFFK